MKMCALLLTTKLCLTPLNCIQLFYSVNLIMFPLWLAVIIILLFVWLLIEKTDKHLLLLWLCNYSVQFSRSVMSDSLRPHESQHARPPCPSPTPGVHSNSRHRVSDSIQPSHPLSSLSPPTSSPSQHQSLFQWVNSSHEVAKVLEFQF